MRPIKFVHHTLYCKKRTALGPGGTYFQPRFKRTVVQSNTSYVTCNNNTYLVRTHNVIIYHINYFIVDCYYLWNFPKCKSIDETTHFTYLLTLRPSHKKHYKINVTCIQFQLLYLIFMFTIILCIGHRYMHVYYMM